MIRKKEEIESLEVATKIFGSPRVNRNCSYWKTSPMDEEVSERCLGWKRGVNLTEGSASYPEVKEDGISYSPSPATLSKPRRYVQNVQKIQTWHFLKYFITKRKKHHILRKEGWWIIDWTLCRPVRFPAKGKIKEISGWARASCKIGV